MQDLTTLVDLATFAAVVRTGSFTAAGEQLGVSKSVVSRRVATLEERYGIRLLHRTSRRMEVTEVGLEVYERSAAVLREAEEAEIAATAQSGEPRGILRVNGPAGLLRRLTHGMPDLLARHPALRVDLSATDRYLEVVGAGFDLTLRVGGALPDASVVSRRLGTVALQVCASPAYLARRGTPTVPDDLRGHDCLRFVLVPADREWRFTSPDGPISVAIDGPVATDNASVLVSAALAGLGLAVLPDFEAYEPLARGELVQVLADHPMERRNLYALFPHRHLVAPKVTAFVQFVADVLQACPDGPVAR